MHHIGVIRSAPSEAACCILDSRFGEFCPTTCGVANFYQTFQEKVYYQLSTIERNLKGIQNLTTITQNQIETVEESNTVIKKQLPNVYIQRIRDIQTEVLRFERTSGDRDIEIQQLESIVSVNNENINNLKILTQQLQDKCSASCQDTVQINEMMGRDCQDIADQGATTSGLYYVKPQQARQQFLVYCEIDSAGRGWTVLQRRLNGNVDFSKNWIQYKEGFGYLSPGGNTEFWLGNEKIHYLTTQSTGPFLLQINLKDWSNQQRYATYMDFKVGSEEDKYRLRYSFYEAGDAGDAFDGINFGDDVSDKFFTAHNGMQFSTPDADNDRNDDGNCAAQDQAGWWMNRCHAANLNGRYHKGGVYTAEETASGFDDGIIWATWHNRWYSLKETTIKIIPYRKYASLQKQRQTQQSQRTRGDFH
uniref:fibrinogen gamma chain isoform X2 n=1 Tax=Pristiophorus japonicus TaxID=55135 RepID=UPI00398EB620